MSSVILNGHLCVTVLNVHAPIKVMMLRVAFMRNCSMYSINSLSGTWKFCWEILMKSRWRTYFQTGTWEKELSWNY